MIIWGFASADGDGHRHASCYYEHTDAHSIGDYGHDDPGPRCDCHAIPHAQRDRAEFDNTEIVVYNITSVR